MKTIKNEAGVKLRVKEILTATPNCWWYMPVQTGYGAQGIPDFIICLGGKFIAIETKFGSNAVTAWQEKQLESIHTAGGVVFVVREDDLPALEAQLRC